MVSRKNRKLDLKKIKVIVELTLLWSIKEVQKTLGHINWYEEVIHDYTIISMPIIIFWQKDVKLK